MLIVMYNKFMSSGRVVRPGEAECRAGFVFGVMGCVLADYLQMRWARL